MIEIVYKLRSEEAPRNVTLTPEEYYDPPEEGETLDEVAVERFAHAVDYLDVPRSEVEWTRISVSFGTRRSTAVSRYYANGRVWMWHRRDADDGEELFIETRVEPDRYHLARFHRDEDGEWIPNYVGIIDDMPDGSQTEDKIIPARHPDPM